MKLKILLATLALAGAVMVAGTQAFSDDKPQGGMPGMTPEMMAQMQQCLKNMQPGEPHKLFENFVGSWKTTTKMWMMGEGSGDPIVTGGTSEVKWVLGNRYAYEEHRGETMMPDETGQMKKMAYEGIGLTGYDNDRNVYVGSWAHNLGTAMLTYSGGLSRDGKTLTLYGTMDEPMMKLVGRHVKYVIRIDGRDRHTFSLYDLHAGDNYKVIEITYERRK